MQVSCFFSRVLSVVWREGDQCAIVAFFFKPIRGWLRPRYTAIATQTTPTRNPKPNLNPNRRLLLGWCALGSWELSFGGRARSLSSMTSRSLCLDRLKVTVYHDYARWLCVVAMLGRCVWTDSRLPFWVAVLGGVVPCGCAKSLGLNEFHVVVL